MTGPAADRRSDVHGAERSRVHAGERRGWQPDTRRGRRLFVAVPVADPVRDAVARIVEEVRGREAETEVSRRRERAQRDVRWVRLDGIHLTLRFLGPTPDTQLDDVAASVRQTALEAKPFRVRLSGAGGFPNADRPRALWLGVTEGASELASLARALDARLARLGWPPDDRPFRAHLTLARADGVPSARDAVADLVRAAEGLDGAWEADRLVLFESHTGNGPARYEALVEAALGA